MMDFEMEKIQAMFAKETARNFLRELCNLWDIEKNDFKSKTGSDMARISKNIIGMDDALEKVPESFRDEEYKDLYTMSTFMLYKFSSLLYIDVNGEKKLAALENNADPLVKETYRCIDALYRRGEKGIALDLARLLGNGIGTDRDDERAFKLYKEDMELNDGYKDIDKKLFMAELYFYGRGTEPDYDKAYELVEERARVGNKKARRLLGMMLYEGKGVEQSREEGLSMLKDLTVSGDSDARRYIVEQAAANISQYSGKLQFFNNFNSRLETDYRQAAQEKGDVRKYLYAYSELKEYLPISHTERARFLRLLLNDQPQAAYAETGVVSPEGFDQEFDQYISELIKKDEEHGKAFLSSVVNSNFREKILEETRSVKAETGRDISHKEANWAQIYDHIRMLSEEKGIEIKEQAGEIPKEEPITRDTEKEQQEMEQAKAISKVLMGPEDDATMPLPVISPEAEDVKKPRFCVGCGKPLSEKDRFCIYCGRKADA